MAVKEREPWRREPWRREPWRERTLEETLDPAVVQAARGLKGVVMLTNGTSVDVLARFTSAWRGVGFPRRSCINCRSRLEVLTNRYRGWPYKA